MKSCAIIITTTILITAVSLYYLDRNHYFSAHHTYTEQEVTYTNPASGLTLSGTLTLPNISHAVPAIILVAGTGKHERNCTMKGHQLFTTMADYLAKKGYAVLRYDKRGVGKSQGTFTTDLTSQDFASDVQAGIAYLKTRPEITGKIGLIGHSEGGLIICMVAAQSDDIAFLILMGGANTTKIEDIVQQACLQLQADGANSETIALDKQIRTKLLSIVHQNQDHEKTQQLLEQAVTNYLDMLTPAQTQAVQALVFESDKTYFEPQAPVYAISRLNYEYMIAVFNSAWIRFLLNYDAQATLQKITVPTTIINGQYDFIVAGQVTEPIFEKNLINCKHTIVQIPGVNHWFESCKNGSIAEYGKTDEIISPLFLQAVGSALPKK